MSKTFDISNYEVWTLLNNKVLSLKYRMFTPSVLRDKKIRKLKTCGETQILLTDLYHLIFKLQVKLSALNQHKIYT